MYKFHGSPDAKEAPASTAVVYPSIAAAVFIEPKLRWLEVSAGEVRHDQSQMPSLRYHWVRLVDGTLAEASGMSVHVGYHFQTQCGAAGPDAIHPGRVKDDHPLQSIWIDIVVEDEVLDDPRLCNTAPKQERTRLTIASPALTQAGQ